MSRQFRRQNVQEALDTQLLPTVDFANCHTRLGVSSSKVGSVQRLQPRVMSIAMCKDEVGPEI